ncbi:MAG: aldo/keto reductase [Proteobacteria bacterium]|nr:aldo/keto reductase [Pseudomonadota bacterium]
MRKHLIPQTDISVSEICLGTMIFGEQLGEEESLLIMDTAMKECGINFIDTAELYPVPPKSATMGRTDEIIGRWLRDNPSYKNQVAICSKVIAYSAQMTQYRGGPRPSQEHFRASLEATLDRLGVDTIDLFLIHWPARNTTMFGEMSFNPKKERTELSHLGLNFHEQAEAMNDFIKEGKIRAWGLSNENTWGVMSFLKVCEQYQLQKPSMIQNAYSLLNRVFETEQWEMCFRENIGFMAYSALAMGHLTGKYLGGDTYPHLEGKSSSRLSLYKEMGQRYKNHAVEHAVKAYSQVAVEYGCELTNLALAFVNQRPFVTSNVVGVSSREILLANMNSLSMKLDDYYLRKINHIHQSYPSPCP